MIAIYYHYIISVHYKRWPLPRASRQKISLRQYLAIGRQGAPFIQMAWIKWYAFYLVRFPILPL
ncbi:MAG: hypothetical protein BSOLF_2623 [Candidatus Carbobacillus altaicus]|uniref:Uncharacterized protein n=1 Tax=Candidatus Carbonibacillus altaicus TaxID=2163959 RepID=A0A2R6Y2D7_9BACL|nr:MAG: hypothetical protein BSOLF_2623 [Candidatus Carbobacillus altaicus]